MPGTAVFLTSDPEFAPTALLHNLKHNKVLHENNVILTIITADTPRVPEEERVRITPMSRHFSRVSLKFGYMEQPNVPKALAIARKHGWQFRHHVDVVLPVAARAEAVRAIGHAALAGPSVHCAGPFGAATRPTSSRYRPGVLWRSAPK